MPYIITTTRARPQFVLPPTGQVTRRARATIQEARDDARDDCFERDYDADAIAPCIAKAESLPESGGIITLPDDTVIEVERVRWAQLARDGGLTFIAAAEKRCDRGDEKSISEVIDAYNARQES